ncbi:MAG: hypothetical protein Q9M26_02280 [Mariprofundales bacterium]|nr:hypothetical protein [Mariprofundales bacterium]
MGRMPRVVNLVRLQRPSLHRMAVNAARDICALCSVLLRCWLMLLLLASSQMGLAQEALAQGSMVPADWRFTVSMPLAVGQGWKQERGDGLGLVLDRLLSRAERNRVVTVGGGAMKAERYLSKVLPQSSQVQFTFRHQMLLDALRARGLHPIAVLPTMALHFTMEGVQGQRMPKTEQQLQQQATVLAARWGIALTADGTPLILRWNWLDDQWISLTVESDNPELATLGGEHLTQSQPPMAQFGDWLERILLRARDGGAQLVAVPVVVDGYSAVAGSLVTIDLIVNHAASLAEQVGLEQVLVAQPQVRALTLRRLSHAEQEYRLQVRGTDWIIPWFASRGMQAKRTDRGWLVH